MNHVKGGLWIIVSIGVILCAAIAAVVLNSPSQELTSPVENIPSIPTPNILKDPAAFRHDVLGVEFKYPNSWGTVETKPQTITDLTAATTEYTDTTNNYHGSVFMEFSEDASPNIRIFSDEYKGDFAPYADASKYGAIDPKDTLKTTGDICDYSVTFDRRPELADTMKEVWSQCDTGIKTRLVQKMEYFGSDFPEEFKRKDASGKPIDTVYSYTLEHVTYKRLQNDTFPYLLAIQPVTNTGQIPEATMTLDDLLMRNAISQDTYEQGRKEFASFAASIKTFQPPMKVQEAFSAVFGEDENMTMIRTYYYLLGVGKLDEAYELLGNGRVAQKTFQEWYGNLYQTHVDSIEKQGDSYAVSVTIQEQNTAPEEYHVIMRMKDGKIKTLSSEKREGKVSYGNLSAYVKDRNGTTSVVMVENGKEYAVATGPSAAKNVVDNIRFGGLRFSPHGAYLIYHQSFWEGGLNGIYDIKKHAVTQKFFMSSYLEFTDDDASLIACAAAEIDGSFYANVYNAAPMKQEFDAVKAVNAEFGVLECNYSSKTKSVSFLFGAPDQPQKRVEYSLDTKKVIVP